MPRLTAKEVLAEAKRVQKTFRREANVFWPLTHCVESVCENDTNVVFDTDKTEALTEAKKLDSL